MYKEITVNKKKYIIENFSDGVYADKYVVYTAGLYKRNFLLVLLLKVLRKSYFIYRG